MLFNLKFLNIVLILVFLVLNIKCCPPGDWPSTTEDDDSFSDDFNYLRPMKRPSNGVNIFVKGLESSEEDLKLGAQTTQISEINEIDELKSATILTENRQINARSIEFGNNNGVLDDIQPTFAIVRSLESDDREIENLENLKPEALIRNGKVSNSKKNDANKKLSNFDGTIQIKMPTFNKKYFEENFIQLRKVGNNETKEGIKVKEENKTEDNEVKKLSDLESENKLTKTSKEDNAIKNNLSDQNIETNKNLENLEKNNNINKISEINLDEHNQVHRQIDAVENEENTIQENENVVAPEKSEDIIVNGDNNIVENNQNEKINNEQNTNNVQLSQQEINSVQPSSNTPLRFGLFGSKANTGTVSGGATASVERAEKLNKGFDKLIHFVNIVGQLDSFFSDRAKSVMRKLSILADSDEDYDRRRRSSYYRRHRRH